MSSTGWVVIAVGIAGFLLFLGAGVLVWMCGQVFGSLDATRPLHPSAPTWVEVPDVGEGAVEWMTGDADAYTQGTPTAPTEPFVQFDDTDLTIDDQREQIHQTLMGITDPTDWSIPEPGRPKVARIAPGESLIP